MSQPTPYDRGFNFTDFQAAKPNDPLPAVKLDAELNGIADTLRGTLTNLAKIQRDDGKLADGVVTVDAISPELFDAIAAAAPAGADGQDGEDAIATIFDADSPGIVPASGGSSLTVLHGDGVFRVPSFAEGGVPGLNLATARLVGTGAAQSITLLATVPADQCLVTVNGLTADPATEYTVVGTTFTITVAADDIVLVQYNAAGVSSGGGTVEPSLSLSGAASTAEGNSGTTNLTCTVTRSGVVTGNSSALWAVTGSGANPVSATDFTGDVLPSGSLLFAAGETVKTFNVPIKGDTTFEQNEGFTVTLSSPAGCALGTAVISGTITNDDADIVYPVDLIGGAAPTFAGGTRKLISSYSGPCLRVRRASDNTEQDIGFTSAGIVDTAALDAFGSGTSLFGKTLYDQSGNGRHAVQATAAGQPRIDNRQAKGTRALAFGFGDGGMVIPAHTISRMNSTLFMMAGANTLGGHGIGDGYFEWAGGFTLVGTGGLSVADLQLGGDPTPGLFGENTNLEVLGVSSSATAIQKFNGEQYTPGSPFNADVAFTGPYTFGAVPTAGLRFNGIVAAVVLYDRPIADAALTAARTAFASAFGTSIAAGEKVLITGDSILSGSTGTALWTNAGAEAARSVAMSSLAHFVTAGASGQTTSVFPTLYAQYKSNHGAPAIVVNQLGTNDIGTTTDTPATIYSRITSICASVHADGGKFIQCTILPRNDLGGPDATRRTDLNTLIRANTAGADAVLDLTTDPIMGPQSASSDGTLYVDGLHTSPLGNAYLSDNYATAVTALL